jgi:hypothetical protein
METDITVLVQLSTEINKLLIDNDIDLITLLKEEGIVVAQSVFEDPTESDSPFAQIWR